MRSAKRPQIPTYPCDQDGHSGAWVDERTERGRGSVKQLDLDDERAHERLNKRQAEEKHCMQKLSEAAGTDQRTEKMNQDRRKHERDDRIVRVLGNQNEILKMKRVTNIPFPAVPDLLTSADQAAWRIISGGQSTCI